MRIAVSLVLLAALAPRGAAIAQSPQPAPPQVTHPPVATPGAPQPPPEQIAPYGRVPDVQANNDLSEKLSRQQGTLRPPVVDPGIQVPLPPNSGGSMPVIPPPGTGGGDQNVVPK